MHWHNDDGEALGKKISDLETEIWQLSTAYAAMPNKSIRFLISQKKREMRRLTRRLLNPQPFSEYENLKNLS